MTDDLIDNLRLFNKSDNTHLVFSSRTKQWVQFIDYLSKAMLIKTMFQNTVIDSFYLDRVIFYSAVFFRNQEARVLAYLASLSSKYTILILNKVTIFILNLYVDFFYHLNTLRDHKIIYYFPK